MRLIGQDRHATSPRAIRLQRWKPPVADHDGRTRLAHLLTEARNAHASDLLIVAGARPTLRVNGRLVPIGDRAWRPDESASLCAALLPDSHAPQLAESGAVDFVLARKGVGRLRCNVHRAQGHWSAAVRLLPERVPDLETLHLPTSLGPDGILVRSYLGSRVGRFSAEGVGLIVVHYWCSGIQPAPTTNTISNN